MDKLQNDYAESEEVLMGWEENSYCAAPMTQEQRWHRAKIQSTPDEDKVQVLAIDFGYQAIMFTNTVFNCEIHKSSLSVYECLLPPANEVAGR